VKRGMMKYNKPETTPPPELELAKEWLERMYGPYMQEGTISFDDAVKDMETGTSPGFPWNKKYIDKQQTLEHNKEWLKTYCQTFHERKAPRAVWSSSLKEEVRSHAKLADNKIRQFSAAPIELVIVGRQLFLKQNEAFYKSNLMTWSAVGITMTNGGWTRVYKHLSKHKRGFALDESEWDSSMRKWLLEAIRDFRIRMLKSARASAEDMAKATAYYEEIINSLYILPMGELVSKLLGNPSGGNNTVVDNTLGLSLMLMITWIRKIGTNYAEMIRNMSAVLYGDDNTLTVADAFIDKFNGRAIKEVFATCGVSVKNPDAELDPRPLDELDFLSFEFLPIGDSVLPKHKNPKKLLASIAFRDSKSHPPALKLQRILALREMLVGHSKYFHHVDRYATYFFKKYHALDADIVNVWSMRKTRREIVVAYLGFEKGWTRPLKDYDEETNFQNGIEAPASSKQTG